jgi:hypothetical protein
MCLCACVCGMCQVGDCSHYMLNPPDARPGARTVVNM